MSSLILKEGALLRLLNKHGLDFTLISDFKGYSSKNNIFKHTCGTEFNYSFKDLISK